MTAQLEAGSLPARLLAHMLQSRAECTVDEASRELSVEASEARGAFVKLAEMGKVTKRLEEGKALYKLPDAANMRIPGSASPLELRREVAKAAEAKGDNEPEPEPVAKDDRKAAPASPRKPKGPAEPAKAEKPATKAGTLRSQILEIVKATPGLDSLQIAERVGLTPKVAQAHIAQLQQRRLIEKSNGARPFQWRLVTRADVSTIAFKKAEEPAAPKKPRAGGRRPRKLHELGVTGPHEIYAHQPTANGAVDQPALAIDASGVVAIEQLRLSPRGILSLIGFLEKTQYVWKGAAA